MTKALRILKEIFLILSCLSLKPYWIGCQLWVLYYHVLFLIWLIIVTCMIDCIVPVCILGWSFLDSIKFIIYQQKKIPPNQTNESYIPFSCFTLLLLYPSNQTCEAKQKSFLSPYLSINTCTQCTKFPLLQGMIRVIG